MAIVSACAGTGRKRISYPRRSAVAITSAISTEPQMIGAASGLYGFMQMANGALCTLAVGFFPANPALSAASVLLAGILLGQYFFLRSTQARFGAGE
jgi:MFS transporter, DHA1 family, multidrug resistance protein